MKIDLPSQIKLKRCELSNVPRFHAGLSTNATVLLPLTLERSEQTEFRLSSSLVVFPRLVQDAKQRTFASCSGTGFGLH